MARQPIVIAALHGGFGGSFNLAKAIDRCSATYSAALVTSRPAYYAFGDGVDVEGDHRRADALLGAKRLFICDCGGLLTLARYLSLKLKRDVTWGPTNPDSEPLYDWLKDKSIVFYWTGTKYCEMHAKMNALADRLPCARRYAMCDILRFDPKAVPLMQTYDGLVPVERKFDRFTACHSPGYKHDEDKKGSSLIAAVVARLKEHMGIDLRLLRGIPYRKALVIKAMSHLFVDQVASEAGGMGKSGLEAMLLGVPTLCDLRHSRFEGYYEGMPARDVRDADSLSEAIVELHDDPKARLELAERCRAWSQRLRFDPTVKYLERTLEWA